jgi:branched-chain amino acid transport system ATP-binding protein
VKSWRMLRYGGPISGMNDIGNRQESTDGLQIKNLSVKYGKLTAVNNVSLSVNPGEIIALAGPNSAGKSSLLQAVATRSRWVSVTGLVSVNGKRIDGLPTRHKWGTGLRLVPQGRQIFPSLNPEENLRVVADNLSVPWNEAIKNARDLFPQIFIRRAGTPAGNLSGGEQQMLALARALIGKPCILLLDEPGLGLARGIINELAAIIKNLSQSGIGILLADQAVDSWARIMSKALVMVRGDIVGTAHNRNEAETLILGQQT